MRILLSFAVVALMPAVAASAQLSEAQNREIFGQLGERLAGDTEDRCMNTIFLPRTKTAEAQAGAQRTLQAYLDAARADVSFDATHQFARDRTLLRWTGPDGQSGDLGSLTDPYARATAQALPEPVRFVRANDLKTALGLWILRPATPDQPGEAYAAAFRRERGRWLLTSLALVTDDAPPPRRYCHVPGDIDRWLGNPVTAAIYGAASEMPPR